MRRIMRKVICVLVALTVLIGIISPGVEAASVKYNTYSNKRFTYTVKYPTVFENKSENGDGAKFFTSDGKAQITFWSAYGKKKGRSGKTVIATAKKNKKIKVLKQSAKEASYTYNSGKNVIQYYYCFLSNGEVAFQITYPKSKKSYYNTAVNGIISSIKKNKQLTLKD